MDLPLDAMSAILSTQPTRVETIFGRVEVEDVENLDDRYTTRYAVGNGLITWSDL